MRNRVAGLVVIILIAGCAAPRVDQPDSTSAPDVIPVSAIDTPAADSGTVAPTTCGELDAVWGNWPAAIDVLHRLIALNVTCSVEPLSSKLYAAHFNYATALEQSGDIEQATDHYLRAFGLDPRRDEALKALYRLKAIPAPTPTLCDAEKVQSAPTPTDVFRSGGYVTVQGDQLFLDGSPFRIRGVNYYPRHSPWDRFLTETDHSEMAAELRLIAEAGFNTVRIFLQHESLFKCANQKAEPGDGLVVVDSLMVRAREYGLKVIVTLNDLPDLYIAPLYTTDRVDDAFTAHIVRRYRDEPALLAWDLRNEPDLDYTDAAGGTKQFTREQVVNWLAHESALVRANDPNHLVTAGWWGDPMVSEPYVDFLSFHLWDDANLLDERTAQYQAASGKPILLEETGYATWGEYNEAGQAEFLPRVTQTAEELNLAGWMIWAAFDLQPKPGQPENAEHHFGLWRLDLSEKPVLDLLPLP